MEDANLDKSLNKKVADIFKTPQDLNWAWQFKSYEDDNWTQFDCPDCLQLEFHYQAHKLSGNDQF